MWRVFASLRAAEDDDGEAVVEAGGVGGDTYCMGWGTVCSMVCIMAVGGRTEGQRKHGRSIYVCMRACKVCSSRVFGGSWAAGWGASKRRGTGLS